MTLWKSKASRSRLEVLSSGGSTTPQLVALAAVLLIAVALSPVGAQAAQVVSAIITDPANPSQQAHVDGAGNVHVAGTVQAQNAIPSGAFSKSRVSGGSPVILGPDPAGTSYAITSLTFTNTVDHPLFMGLFAAYGTTNDCLSVIGGHTVYGPYVFVPAYGTVHLSFPQPFVFAAQPGEASCLDAQVGPNEEVTVVGYTF